MRPSTPSKARPARPRDVRELLAFDLLGRPIQRWHHKTAAYGYVGPATAVGDATMTFRTPSDRRASPVHARTGLAAGRRVECDAPFRQRQRDGTLAQPIPCPPPRRARSTLRLLATKPDSHACRDPRPVCRNSRPNSPGWRRSGSACPGLPNSPPRTRRVASSCADRASSTSARWFLHDESSRKGPSSSRSSRS